MRLYQIELTQEQADGLGVPCDVHTEGLIGYAGEICFKNVYTDLLKVVCLIALTEAQRFYHGNSNLPLFSEEA